MAIEDIKGYKPHTDDKVNKVNAIKDAEIRLGLIFDSLLEDALTESTSDGLAAVSCLSTAKEKLKEASMWACRAVFRPEEKY